MSDSGRFFDRTTPARRRVRDLDGIDRKLCDLLLEDPRITRRELAAAVGVTDETVAARLRLLRRRNVIATTLAVDWQAAGYSAGAILRLAVRGHDLAVAARPACQSDNLVFAGVASGCCDLVLALLAVDLDGLRTEIARLRSDMDHVELLATDLVTDAASYDVNTHTLPVEPWSVDELPRPDVRLDDVDRRLIAELAVAGDESNRSIARRLGVSDATVKSRLRRLEDANLVRVVTARDPVTYGDRLAHALVFVTLDAPDTLRDLGRLNGVLASYASLGACDAILALGTPTDDDLNRTITRDLRRAPGVQRVEVANIVTVLRHRTHLVRLV